MRHVAATVDEFRIGWRHHHADCGDGRRCTALADAPMRLCVRMSSPLRDAIN
jgi:hypothetical protein